MLVRDKRTRSFNELSDVDDSTDLHAGVNGRRGLKRSNSSDTRPLGIFGPPAEQTAPQRVVRVKLERAMSPSVASTASDTSEASEVSDTPCRESGTLTAWGATPHWMGVIDSPESHLTALAPPVNLSPLSGGISVILAPPSGARGLRSHAASLSATSPLSPSLAEQTLLWRISELRLDDKAPDDENDLH